MIIAALLLAAQVGAVETVATCRAPNDPHQRVWVLERTGEAWRAAFSATSLDKPHVYLPLLKAALEVERSGIHLVYATANGGRRIDWTITNGASTLDLYVNHGLEVNIERDLDPAVEQMNTEGPINLQCTMPNDDRKAEWIVAVGVAKSVNLYQSAAGRSYAVQTIGWSKELTREITLIGIRGRFAWGVEAMPLFAQLEPSRIYGVGFAPVIWRWNFPPKRTWSAFAELSMGGLLTNEPIPEETSRGNFSAHWGGGVRLRSRHANGILIAYRFQHFSNGNQLASNPGVNSHVILAGWSHRS
ncbi:MAG TPA: acyloxyacyl hydrolase [Vicinamibacterales bacterium]|nr:acyloxyacyl hydrolase [Vicinamibacterales bacterium]